MARKTNAERLRLMRESLDNSTLTGSDKSQIEELISGKKAVREPAAKDTTITKDEIDEYFFEDPKCLPPHYDMKETLGKHWYRGRRSPRLSTRLDVEDRHEAIIDEAQRSR